MHINLLIDGGSFLYRTLAIQRIPEGRRLLDDKSDIDTLAKKYAIDFAYQIKLWGPISNRIIIGLESKSWRKQYTTTYKSNRTENNKINWEACNELQTTFLKCLSRFGVETIKVEGAEADDIVACFAEWSIENGQSSIILSSDADLKQLIQYKDNCFVNYHDMRSKTHYLTKEFLDSLSNTSDVDIFTAGQQLYKQRYNEILSKKAHKIKIKTEDRHEFAFKKMIYGDEGDGIPRFVKKVGPKKIHNVWEAYISLYDFDINDLLNDDCRVNIVKQFKHTTQRIDLDEDVLLARLEDYINLMLLSSEVIPENITKTLGIRFNGDYPEIQVNHLSNYKKILENTEYDIEDVVPKSIDPFSSFKVPENKNKDKNKLF